MAHAQESETSQNLPANETAVPTQQRLLSRPLTATRLSQETEYMGAHALAEFLPTLSVGIRSVLLPDSGSGRRGRLHAGSPPHCPTHTPPSFSNGPASWCL